LEIGDNLDVKFDSNTALGTKRKNQSTNAVATALNNNIRPIIIKLTHNNERSSLATIKFLIDELLKYDCRDYLFVV
jgi:hypothetical protein